MASQTCESSSASAEWLITGAIQWLIAGVIQRLECKKEQLEIIHAFISEGYFSTGFGLLHMFAWVFDELYGKLSVHYIL